MHPLNSNYTTLHTSVCVNFRPPIKNSWVESSYLMLYTFTRFDLIDAKAELKVIHTLWLPIQMISKLSGLYILLNRWLS